MSTGPDLTGIAAIVLGTALVSLNLTDIFRSVILPRARPASASACQRLDGSD
jgi:hypothetical protein